MKHARLLILSALMVSIGGQWMVLQGVAWLGMAVSYSVESGSVTTGLSKTFDGDHPCALCKAVQKSSQEDHDPAAPAGGKSIAKSKAELCSFEPLRIYPPAASRLTLAWHDLKALARTTAPEAPPPRLPAA